MGKIHPLVAALCASLIAVPSFAAPGPPASLFVVVGADGTLARGSSAKIAHGGTGSYLVDFPVNIPGCTFIAGVGTADKTQPSAGTITLAPGAGNKNVVFVSTFDGSGNAADQPFHLVVNCASEARNPEVAGAVDAGGNVVRALGISGASHPDTGVYEVNTDISDASSACATPATIGAAGTTVPSPGMVSVAQGTTTSDIEVYTFDVDGNPADRPFQLYVEC